MTTVEKSASAGFPFFSILTLIFVIAKLVGKITWSWWWVFSPLWVPVAVGFTITALVLIGFLLLDVILDK